MVEADDDAIDLHDLQAQIDLSMSFVQNLVTSWVKPTHDTRTDRQRALEDELKEFMRQPARLGVGAPVPEEWSFIREAAKLRSKFRERKKRLRDEQGVDMKQVQSDNEEESRTRVIKKKARIDPFSTLPRKRKDSGDSGKTRSVMHPAAMEATPPKRSSLAKDVTSSTLVARELVADPITLKNNKSSVDHKTNAEEQELANIKITPPPIDKSPATFELSRLCTPSNHDISKLSALPSAVPPSNFRQNTSEDLTVDASFLQQPLLNLRCSPRKPESDSIDHSELTPKKKRKRRRKKKLLQNIEMPLHLKTDGAISIS